MSLSGSVRLRILVSRHIRVLTTSNVIDFVQPALIQSVLMLPFSHFLRIVT